MNPISAKLEEFVAEELSNTTTYQRWSSRVSSFLRVTLPDHVSSFENLGVNTDIWKAHAAQSGLLDGIALKLESEAFVEQRTNGSPSRATVAPAPIRTKKVFVVHGHDSEAKEAVARFIERLGLEPIILHEQPNAGRTVIEKFEVFADVSFAVVLLTPDDVGQEAGAKGLPSPRARQNVIAELGYFVGKLTRSRVCALYKAGVEIPSDFHGVLYVELDEKGAWRTKLAQELSDAGMTIKLEALLKS